MNELDEKPRGARLVTAITTTTALSLSVLFHGSLPFLGNLIREKRQATSIELIAAAPPPPMAPLAEEEKEGPKTDPEPEGKKADSNKDAKSGSKNATAKKSTPPAKAEPKPPAKKVVRRAPPPKPTRKANLRQGRRSAANLTTMTRAERLEQLRNARARASKGKKSKKAGGKGGSKGDDGKGGGEGGGAHAAGGGKKGDIDPVYACTKDGLGKQVNVRYERPIGDWVTIMPTVLMPFETRPGLSDYLPGVSQIVSRKRRGIPKAGPVEFALPAQVVQLGVDGKPGVRVALGHLDGRCLVGLKYSRQLFPIEMFSVPVRVVDSRGNSATALADIKLFKDASFDIVAKEGHLPFKSGRLENADGIANTIEQHYGAARAFKEVAGWFGVDVQKAARERRVERAKKRASEFRKSRRVTRSRR